MSNIGDRIREIQNKIKDLNVKVQQSNNNADSDSLTRFKRQLLTGPVAPLGINATHNGNSKGTVIVITKTEGIHVRILIEDLLDVDTKNVKYTFTNFDFKLNDTVNMGIVYQANGIVRVEEMVIKYDETYKKYTLQIDTDRDFQKGRLFITVDVEVNSTNYIDKYVELLPLCTESPINGSGCRPCQLETPIYTTGEDINPFN